MTDAPLILTTSELVSVTGRQRFSAQRRALDKMKIRYMIRPDGRPVVARSAIDTVERQASTFEPNWSAL